MSFRLVIIALCLFVLVGFGVHWLRNHVTLSWNETESLPQTLFWVWKGEMPKRGDYVLFTPPPKIKSKYPFIKIVGGIGGDTIQVQNRIVVINQKTIGLAKTQSKRGQPLSPIAPCIIPPHHYFIYTKHRDSYDSRYQSIGLVPDTRIIGRASPLF